MEKIWHQSGSLFLTYWTRNFRWNCKHMHTRRVLLKGDSKNLQSKFKFVVNVNHELLKTLPKQPVFTLRLSQSLWGNYQWLLRPHDRNIHQHLPIEPPTDCESTPFRKQLAPLWKPKTVPSLKPTFRTWKRMLGILSFWKMAHLRKLYELC